MKVYIGRYPKDPNKERKVRVQIDKWDTWSLDHTLALIILPALVAFRDSGKHGYPGAMIDTNRPELLTENGGPNEAGDVVFSSHWDEIIDKMIFAFESFNNDWESQFYTEIMPGEADYTPTLDHTGFEVEYIGKNMRYDHEGLAAYQERIDEGLQLFAKYFQNLWT